MRQVIKTGKSVFLRNLGNVRLQVQNELLL